MTMRSDLYLPANPTATRRQVQPRHTHTGDAWGFSLVELMVAMAIGLVIIVGLTTLYVSSVSGKKTAARFSEFQTNARFAMDVIKRDPNVTPRLVCYRQS